MLSAKYPAMIFLVIVIVAVAMPIIYYPQLPETVASHFNYKGEADGSMTKSSFIIIQFALTLFMAIMFGALAIFIPKMPMSLINMPNKDYWLNDENKEETRKLIQRFLLWFGSITLGFTTLIFQETLQVNLARSNKLNSNFWIYFAAFMVLTSIFTIKFVLHFRKKNIPGQTERT